MDEEWGRARTLRLALSNETRSTTALVKSALSKFDSYPHSEGREEGQMRSRGW